MKDYWEPIATAPANVPVLTKIHDERGVRNEQVMTRRDRLWWIGNGADAMYVYYTPTHWKPVAAEQGRGA